MELPLYFVLALVAGSFAGPIQDVVVSDNCARQCTVSNKFNYEAGMTYEFTYETDIQTAIQGAAQDHAGVHLASNVHLDFISKCEMRLRMSDVKLSEHDPETSTMKPVVSDLIADLENNPLTVSYQDGNIEELCLRQMESDKTLNIKRGLLSLIQNNMDDITAEQTVTESDVSGNCETQYKTQPKGWYNTLITKSKNLIGCTSRHSSISAVKGIPYQSNSGVQNTPIVKSTQECEQELTKETGRLQSAKCHETHMFVPFSRQDSGVVTHNTQTLTFVKEFKSNTKPETVNVRAPLTFQHSTGNSAEVNMKTLERNLMDICTSTTNGVTEDTPNMFRALVYTLKAMKASDMDAIYQKIKSQAICSTNNKRVAKFFLDAIPMTGSIESVRYMTQLLTAGEVSGVEADMWMTTLAFVQNPSLDMLSDVKSLLSVEALQEKAMLSVSSMVNSLCRHNADCDNFIQVKKIISLLEQKIAPSCKITDETLQTSLLALRAIGNAGFGTGATSTLVKCFQRADNPIEVRLSAIEAFRRMPCTADKSAVMRVFSDMDEDSEVRIAAYKALMECASDDLIRSVKIVLSKETVNQVGSYVWTHLTNLMETSDPHKQAIRSVLEDETLKQTFNMDNRKFSRNYEGSMFLEKINTGATVESDLIWSTKSFIPRAGMFNFTVDLFGNAINLFEIGGRVEGLEYFLESYFGPNGYFSQKDVQSAVDETAVDVIKADKVKRIDKRMNTVMDDLRGSMYMRVFGNEIRYMNFQGLDSLLNKNTLNFVEVLMKLSQDNDYQFSHSTMIVDSSIIVPTSSGFPMNLTVNGTATVDLKASGKMDVMKLASSPPTLDVNGILRPSAAIVISSIMGVDALSTQTGVKMVSTMHTSTSVQGKLTLAEGSILTAEFNLPDEKMEVINVKSEFYTIHGMSTALLQKMITENRKEHSICSGDKLAKLTGLELCGELNFPNASLVENAPYFPITGPVNAGITLFKRDAAMTGYKLEARSTHDRKVNIVRFAFSTPNSKVDRTFLVDLSLSKVDGTFEANLESPWRQGSFKGAMVYTRLEKGLSGKLNWNNKYKADVVANLKAARSGPGMLYTPTLSIRSPGMKPINVKGTVKYAAWKILQTELTIGGFTPKPITLKTNIADKTKVILATATLKLGPKQEYSYISSMQQTKYKKKIIFKPRLSIRTPTKELIAFGGTFTNVYGKNIQLDVVLDKIVSTPIMWKSNYITKLYRRGRVQNLVRLDFRSAMADIKLKSKLDNRNMKTIATDVDLTYVIKGIARDNIKFVSKVSNLSNKKSSLGRGSMNMASKNFPEFNLKIMSNINHNWKVSGVDMDIYYGPNFKNKENKIGITLSATRAIKSWTYASFGFNSKVEIGTKSRYLTKIDHSNRAKSLSTTVMLRQNKDVVQASIELMDQSRKLKSMFGQVQIDLPRGRTILFSQGLNETEPGVFECASKARMGKTQHSVVTSWSKPTPNSLSLTSDIALSKMTPVTINAEYSLEDDTYRLGGSMERSGEKYSGLLSTKMAGNGVQAAADIEYPSRHIVGNYEGKMAGERYTSKADLRWNADRDDSQRVTVNGNGQITDLSNFDGGLTLQYPSRLLAFNVKQSSVNKFATHADFKWDTKQAVSVDTTFGYYEKDGQQYIATVKVETPFAGFQSMDLDVNHQVNDDAYTTTADLAWSPKNAVSGTMTLRRPFTLSNINAELIAKAPSQGLRSILATFNHHIDAGLLTVGKLAWNKQSMQVSVALTNETDETKTDLKGQIDIKSSYRAMKSVSVTVEHNNNGKKVDTNAVLQLNKKTFGLQSSVKGRASGWNLLTSGDVSLTVPAQSYAANWQHKSSLSDVASTSTLSMNGKTLSVKLNGLQDMSLPTGKLSTTLEIQTPYNSLKDIVLQINHLHNAGQIDSSASLRNEELTLAHTELKYLRENNQVTSTFTMSNPVYDGDVIAMMNADYSAYPSTGHFELSLTPLQKMTIDGSFDMKKNKDMDGSLQLTLPNMTPITLTASREASGYGFNSALNLEYQPEQVIRVESFHRLNRVKEMTLKFTSPFTTEYSVNGMYKPTKSGISASAGIEAEPYVSKWELSGAFDNANGVSGNIKIDTPYPEMSYHQLSLLSDSNEDERQYSVIAEYIPGQIVKVQTTYDIKSINDIKMSVGVNTPFELFPYGRVEFRHDGDLTQFSTHGEVEYARGKTMAGDAKFSTMKGITGSLAVKTPFTKDMTVSFTHDGTMEDFQTHFECSCNSTVSADIKHQGTWNSFSSSARLAVDDANYGSSLTFSMQPTIDTIVVIEVPSMTYRLAHNLDGTSTKFTDHLEASMTGYGMYTTDLSVDLESAIDISAAVQTPIKGFRDIKAAFKHEGSMDRFQTHVELQNARDLYMGDVKLSTEPAFNFETSIQTPIAAYRKLRFALTHEGSAKNFKLHTEVQKNKELSEMDLNVNVMKKWDIDATIRSPYSDTIKASLDHWGKPTKFQSKLTVAVGKQRLQSNAKFQMSPSMSGLLNIKSPISWLKNHQLSFKHAGSPNSFKCNFQYKMNGKTYVGDASFQHLNSLTGELNLKGPSFRPIKALLSHEGGIQNFKTAASVATGKKAIEVNANMKTVDGIKGSLDVTTPFSGYEKMNAAVSHSGAMDNFKSHAEVGLKAKKIEGDVAFDSTLGTAASASLSTPFNGYKDVSAMFKHTGELNSFNTIAQFSNGRNSIDGQASFNNGDIVSGSASLKSTYPELDNYEASFNHQGDLSNFKTGAEVKYGDSRSVAQANFDSTNGYEGGFEVESPLIKKTELTFKHARSDNAINTNGYIAYDGVRQYGIQSDLSVEPSLSGIVTVTTPHEGYEQTEMTMHHAGDMNSFRTGGAFMLFGEKYETEVGFSPMPDMQLSLTLKSPHFEDIESTFEYQGNLFRFDSRYEVFYAQQSRLRIETDLNLEGPISGDFKMVSPHIKNAKASFKHSGDMNSFTSEYLVMYAGQKTSATATFQLEPLQTTMEFASPLTKPVKVTLSHTGPITNCVTSGDVTYGKQSVLNIASAFELDTTISGEMKMTSVIPGFSLVSAKISKEGDMTDLKSHAEMTYEDSTMSGDLTFSTSQGSIVLSAPFMNDITGSFQNDNTDMLRGMSTSKLSYGDMKMYEITLSMNMPENAELTIEIPVDDYEMTKLSYKRAGDAGGQFEIDLNGVKHEGSAYITGGRKMSGVAHLSTPLVAPVVARFDYTFNRYTFLTNAEFTYDSNTFEAGVEFKRRPAMSGRLSIKTPYTESMATEFTFKGKPRNFKATGTVTYGDDSHTAGLNLNTVGKIEGQMTANSPLMSPVDMSFEHSGDMNNFKSTGTASYGSETHEAGVAFSNLDKIEGQMNVNSPRFAPVTVGVEHTGDMSDFNTHAELSMGGETHKVNAGLKTVDGIEATFGASSPAMVPVDGRFTLSGKPTNFQSNIDMNVDNQKTTGQVSMNVEDEITGSMKMNCPSHTMTASFEHSGAWNDFSTHGDLTLDGSENKVDASLKMMDDIEATFGASSDLLEMTPMTGRFTLNGKPTNFQSMLEMNKRSTAQISLNVEDEITGSMSLDCPYTSISASFNHEGSLRNFKSEAQATMDGRQARANVAFNIETAMTGDIDMYIAGVTKVVASFEHTGDASNFRNTFTIGDASPIIASVVTFSQSPLQGNVDLTTRFPGYETITAMFNHQGEVLNFNNHAELVINGDKTQADMSFDIGSKLEGKMSTSSPYFPSVGLGFDFSGTGSKSQSSAQFAYDNNQFSVDADIDLRTDIDVALTIKTPIKGYKIMTGKLTHSGVFPEINSFVQMKSGRRNMMTGSVDISTTNGINAKVSAQSIFTPTVQISFDHQGDMSQFQTNADVRVDGKPNSIAVTYKAMPSAGGSVVVNSQLVKPISVSYTLNGQTMHMEGTYDEQTVSGDMRYNYGRKTGASISLRSPFEGYEKMDASASVKNTANAMSAEAEVVYAGITMNMESDVTFNRDGLKASAMLSTPATFIGRAKADFSYSFGFDSATTDLSVTAMGQKYSLEGELAHHTMSSGKLAVVTPFPGYETLGASFNRRLDSDTMTMNAKVNVRSEEIVFTAEHLNTDSRLETKARLETPYTEDLAFDMQYSGEPMNFYQTVSLSMGDDLSATLSTTSKIQPTTVAIESTLRTVLTGYADEQKVTVNYDGQFPNVKASASAKVLGSFYSTEAEMEMDDVIKALFKLNTPIQNFRDVGFNFEHKGKLSRFSTKAEIEYSDNKKIEGNVQYVNYNWRRLESSLEVNTPFAQFETTKVSYRHTATDSGFECDADASILRKDFTGTLRASPMEMSLALTTPFAGFEQIGSDMKLTQGEGMFNGRASVNYMEGKTISLSTDMNMNNDPKSASIKMATPFTGFENAEVSVSHTGEWNDFQSTATFESTFASSIRAQANLKYTSLSNIDGALVFTSDIDNFENLQLSVNNEVLRGKYGSKIEMSWSPSQKILFDGTFTDNRYATSADVTVRTPFSILRRANLYTKTSIRGTSYAEKMTLAYNGAKVADMDVKLDMSARKALNLVMRYPVEFSMNMDGEIDDTYQGSFSFSPEIDNSNKGMKMSGSFDPTPKKLTIKYTCPVNTINFEGTMTKANVDVNGQSYGYDTSLEGNDKYVKAIFPQRSLMATLSQTAAATEGYFKWDADKDESKMIGFRSAWTPTTDAYKADVTLMMPSMGKDLQIDSEMIVNRGRIMFDGKTELTYSRDMSKKFTITSRVEDLSTSSSNNYSFTFGISHPYTNVDLQFASHVGNSDAEMTGAVDVKYLTAKRETQSFSANGELDKVRNSVSLNVDTPMKKIGINGVVKTSSPYRLSMSNKYDNKRPLNTVISVNPGKKTFDLSFNYDLDNPSSEFHVSAKYVNSSAVAAEMYHVVNRQRINDAVMTLRLNNSHLLHSRIHWRPQLVEDLKALAERKSASYSRQLKSFNDVVSRNVMTELNAKSRVMKRSINEEMEPFYVLAAEQAEKAFIMYETNQYHTKDITDAVVNAAVKTEERLSEAAVATEEFIELVAADVEVKLAEYMEEYKETMKIVILKLEEATGIVADKSSDMYTIYSAQAYNMSKPYLDSASNSYNDYVNYVSQMDTSAMTNMADAYTSTIYGARDYMNAGLDSVMAHPVMQQGKNAYKYWEVRENAETVADAIVEWIKSEIENQISDIKATILNFKKTAVTVYDPVNGEIQVEVYLPMPVQSLDSVPTIEVLDLTSMARAERLWSNIPSFEFPAWNVSEWLPPYSATAMIKGNTITTFDGIEYDLSSSCTFLMARDNVDGNFTLVLNKDGDNKTLIVQAYGKSIELFSNGQVHVDKKAVAMPAVINDLTVTSEDGTISVDVADSLDVTFYPDIDTYIININGFYFGKTNGILGSYDNEPSNDMITSFGKPITNPTRFVKTWDVGAARCK